MAGDILSCEYINACFGRKRDEEILNCEKSILHTILCAEEWAVHLLPCNSSRLKWLARHCTARPPPCFYQVDIDINHVKKSPLGAFRPFGVPFKFPCNAMYMYSTRYVYMHYAIKGSVKCYAVSSMKWMLGWGEDKSPLQEGSKAKNSYHICYKILEGVMAQRRLKTWRSWVTL